MQSNYRRLGPIGHGQFGRVYCAMHRQTGEIVAIKVLKRLQLPSQAFLDKLSDRLSFNHPNIVICKALEQTDEGRQLVLEYCEGGTLRSRMERTPQFETADVLQLGMDILTGLAYVHRQGIIHCDIKPENILLHYHQGHWIAKISDFGVAKLTHGLQPPSTPEQAGSPAYMAPEQFDDLYSPASDIYAVGIILFELLTGHRPFYGTPDELMSAHLTQPVAIPKNLLAPWPSILLTALSKLPAQRYASAEQMLAALQTMQLPPSLPQPKPTLAVFSGKSVSRFTQPVKHLWAKFSGDSVDDCRLYAAHPNHIAVAHLCANAPSGFQSGFQSIAALSAPPRALLGAHQTIWPQTICVLTDGGIYGLSAEHPPSLKSIVQFQRPSQGAIARRWWAVITPVNHDWQLTVGSLRTDSFWVNQSLLLPPGFEVQQMLAIDKGHLLLVEQPSRHRTQLQLLTRRGHLLGRFDLGLSVRSLTPTLQPYRFLCRSDEVGAVVLDVNPIRVMPLALKIQPMLMASVSWGYLFLDSQGKLAIVDIDYQPLGEVQGPQNPTAMAVVAHRLFITTWTPPQGGELYSLDLTDLGLDIVF